jgi:hypothetical protein
MICVPHGTSRHLHSKQGLKPPLLPCADPLLISLSHGVSIQVPELKT